jgi:hypothetical protein
MSWFRGATGPLALAVLVASGGCGSTTSPSATTYTETFTGTLSPGGTDYGPAGSPHHFTVHQAGNVDATLTSIQPLSTITLGLSLGVWDSTAQSCARQVWSDAAQINLTLAASVSVAGELCVGVYDVGNISSDTITYTVVVTHS